MAQFGWIRIFYDCEDSWSGIILLDYTNYLLNNKIKNFFWVQSCEGLINVFLILHNKGMGIEEAPPKTEWFGDLSDHLFVIDGDNIIEVKEIFFVVVVDFSPNPIQFIIIL